MLIIGCDYHPSFQQIAWVDTETGECGERRLEHRDGEAEKFYRGLNGHGVRVGIEATGHARWLERLLAKLKYELWVGDPAQIRAQRVRKQKNDRQDAQLLLQLMLEDRFPRVWNTKSGESGSAPAAWASASAGADTDAGHESMAGRGSERRSAAQEGAMEPARAGTVGIVSAWATRRRRDLLELVDRLSPRIDALSRAIAQEAERRVEVQRLMTHPGVGPLTALA